MNLENMKEDEILTEAMKQGYNPEYEGENKKTPKEYLEVSFSHNKMLKERNEKLSDQIDELKHQVNQVIAFANEQKQKAVESAVNKLKAERQEAISDGDVQKVEQLDEQIQQQTVANTQSNPILDAWMAKNRWYENDLDLAIEADIIAKQLQDTGRFTASPDDYSKLLAQVEQRVKKNFPDKFKNPKKDDPPEVEPGQPSPNRQSKHTYAELPTEAKRACDKFVKEGVMTKEQYLEIYEWD